MSYREIVSTTLFKKRLYGKEFCAEERYEFFPCVIKWDPIEKLLIYFMWLSRTFRTRRIESKLGHDRSKMFAVFYINICPLSLYYRGYMDGLGVSIFLKFEKYHATQSFENMKCIKMNSWIQDHLYSFDFTASFFLPWAFYSYFHLHRHH